MFRAAPPAELLIEPLDELVAVYHRRSGITHLLASPAPELLDLAREPGTADELFARLAERFDLAGEERDALIARLDELVEAGLVERL